jgi:hypothetical protein
MTDQDIALEVEQFIDEAFERNYEALRVETARTLSPAGREAARRQVLLYWRKLRHIAENVTDTEVRLSLPNQESPAGRKYSIHGIVDIVRDDDRTVMYDIKTHDPEYVRANLDLYIDQLNVYAHIWRELRDQPLDETGIIGTRLPPEIHRALDSGDQERLEYAMQGWDPLITVPFDVIQVEETIEEFGEVVDDIEDGRFRPRSVRDLRRIVYANETFAFRTCRQCDARFSCDAYRRYMRRDQPRRHERRYWAYFDDFGLDEEQEMWQTTTLEAGPTADDLSADFDERGR